MKNKTKGKIGFFASLSISVSSVIGIGIFFKNISIFKNQTLEGTNNFSLYSFLLVWILGALLSLLTAYCFLQVSKSGHSKSGLSGWISNLSNKKQGYLARIFQAFLYYGILGTILPILSTEMIFNAVASIRGINVTNIHFGYVVLTGFFVGLSLITLNFLSLKTTVFLQQFSFFFKIIPLLIAITIAFIGSYNAPNINSENLNPGANGIASTKFFNWSGLFLSLPIVLFAFDAFLMIGNLADDMKKPKQIPIVSILTIIISGVIYFFISLGVALTGYANVVNIFSSIFKNQDQDQIHKIITIIVYFMLGFSGYFVCNSVTLGTLRGFEGLVEEKNIIGANFFSKLDNRKHGLGGYILYLIVFVVYSALLFIPSIILNTDSLIDTFSNIPINIFFLVYAYAIYLALKKHLQTKEPAIRFFKAIALISIISIVIIMGFDIIYRDIYLAFIKGGQSNSGVFYASNNWKYIYDGISYWGFIIVVSLFAYLNYYNHFKKQKTRADLI
ncbi:amino acid permease [Mycoplasmopsis glycophila]|uniref:Amino acid permease n=1 Tax=Mycoplasmopsis glycophila TaxID=171285 RepID=A0A449AW79_9BACT|nr:amino acid permease [Mycoplasmopsis glycophila]VEU70934.1 Uncharacterised protein [Mycoplasmopsis glycophila]